MDNQSNQNPSQEMTQPIQGQQTQPQPPLQQNTPSVEDQGLPTAQSMQPVGETANKSQTPNLSAMKMPKMPHVKIPRKFLVVGVVLVVIIILLIVVLAVAQNLIRMNNGTADPTAETSPTPTPTTTQGSPYADDPDVLEIKNNVEEFESSLNSTRIREDTLRVPVLEWDVNFEN